MATIFKKGDRVFDIEYGWGNVVEIQEWDRYAVKVIFDEKCQHTYLFDGKYPSEGGYPRKVLSFTEYKLEGFSQERPKELPQKGDIVWVKDDEDGAWLISHFIKKENGLYYCSDAASDDDYSMPFAYLTTKNPYSNEKN
jgi:hypothetical protein